MRVLFELSQYFLNIFAYRRPTIEINELIPCYWLPVVDGTVLRYLNIGDFVRMEKTLNIDEKFSFNKD